MTYVNLEMNNGKTIHFNNEHLQPSIEELLSFLEDQNYMREYSFAKGMLMGPEIKSNNMIEGIADDIGYITQVINDAGSKNSHEKRRITNLYHGYQYILTHKTINQESLKELYSILSEGLLSIYDLQYMGPYYRTKPVFILKGSHIGADVFLGMDANKLDYYMNQFFEYINSPTPNDEIAIFIKSQIMHFYFVYIHPYFDVNGRTSRTVAMWYMLNNQVYPYLIFNQAISFARNEYEKNIINARSGGDVTLFLRYIINQVEWALEKEYVVRQITLNNGNNFSTEELQLINYLLTIKGNITIKDLTSFYNRFNSSKKPGIFFDEQIVPLIDKGIILTHGYTQGNIDKTRKNIHLSLNLDNVDLDEQKTKHLILKRTNTK